MELRPYQSDAIEECRQAIARGKKCPLLVAPTGAGKTVIFADIIKRAVANGHRVIVLAHRREIITQTALKLSACGIEYGIIRAGLVMELEHQVQVCSVQTLWARAMRTNKIPLPPADLLIVDEAHHVPARTYREIIEAYPNAILLGATATPCRADGRGLGNFFDCVIETPQVAELIGQKHLVKTLTYAPGDFDLKGVEVRTGDYVESQLADRMDRPDLVGDIIGHWHKYGGRRKTVCFAVNVAHSVHIRDEFIKSGVKAEHIDGTTPKPERDAVLARLASGETDILTNCMVLTEGWDLPQVACCILARPTKQIGLYRQMVGRVLRPAPGKVNAIVLDHSGAVFRHGFVEDRVEWTLETDKRAYSPAHATRLRSGYSSRLVTCSQCRAIRTAGEPCGHCGFFPQRRPDAVIFRDGDLALVDRKSRAIAASSNPDDRIRWHAMLTHIATTRSYKAGWAAHMYREKFGTWPAVRTIKPLEPAPEVLSWARSRAIRYAKAKEAASAA
jgi:superfamily II DNA or RNA helicase